MRRIIYIVLCVVCVLGTGLHTGFAAQIPSPITDLAAASNDSSIGLTWSAPAANPAITDYLVFFRQYGTSTWTQFDDGVSTATSATVTGLTNGTYYDFMVKAVNSVGSATDSNIETGVPLAEAFSDNFESYVAGSNINGQNGWVAGGSTSPYLIESVDGSQVVQSTVTGSDCFTTNNINHPIPVRATNTRMKVDFKYTGNGGVDPQMWLRKQGLAGDVGGYIAFRSTDNNAYIQRQPNSGGCALYVIGSGTSMALTTGNWYTTESDAITLPDGTARMRMYIYPQGGTRGAPFATGIDTSGSIFDSGNIGLGRNTATQVYYDNLHVYSETAIPAIPPIATNVSISGQKYIDRPSITLTGSYTYGDANHDPEGTSLFRWLQADTANGTYTAIPGATSITYNATTANLGKYLKFEVTPVSTAAPTTGVPATSNPFGAIVDSEYWGVLVTGQSHTTGYGSSPALSTRYHPWNAMPSDGVEGTNQFLTSLLESGQGQNGNVETPSSGIANTLFDQNQKHPIFISVAGSNGYGYVDLKKGTPIYARALTQATNASIDLVNNWDATYTPKAVVVIHGETDWLNKLTSTYEANLEQWQRDYKVDLNAIGHSNEPIPMFIVQTNSVADGTMSQVQLQTHIDNPGTIILVGPKYQFPYNSDALHFTNTGSRALGELIGKVMERVLTEGQGWNPLMPTLATINGKVITLSFNIPNPPLAIDTTLVAARPNYGFEFYQDNGNPVTITNVALSSDQKQVLITLSDKPTGDNLQIRYAWTCGEAITWCGDPANPNRIGGNIRDSDAYVSPSADSSHTVLYNWLVSFSQPVVDVVPKKSGVSSRIIQNLVQQGVIDPTKVGIPGISQVTPNTTPQTFSCSPYLPLTTILSRHRLNDKALVTKLQQFLKDRGYGPTLLTTGNFLSRTEAAVKKFQTAYASDILTPAHIPAPTGVVGSMTVKKINEVYCKE